MLSSKTLSYLREIRFFIKIPTPSCSLILSPSLYPSFSLALSSSLSHYISFSIFLSLHLSLTITLINPPLPLIIFISLHNISLTHSHYPSYLILCLTISLFISPPKSPLFPGLNMMGVFNVNNVTEYKSTKESYCIGHLLSHIEVMYHY